MFAVKARKKILDQYRMFHGKSPVKISAHNFHIPQYLVLLGKAVAIEYEIDKVNGGGDGKKHVYRHTFEKPTFLCMDERSGKSLYITGKHLTITEAGIEN